MKRIVASVGLVAVGASGLQADLLPGLTTESGKPWTASATLRGFYDDNFNTLPNNAPPRWLHRGSSGFEVSPSLRVQLFRWSKPPSASATCIPSNTTRTSRSAPDRTLRSNPSSSMPPSPTPSASGISVSVRDSFVIGQEPDFLRAGNTLHHVPAHFWETTSATTARLIFRPSSLRSSGLNWATPIRFIPTRIIRTRDANGNLVHASNAGLLDELDNVVHLDGRYQLQPQTIGVVGFQFRETDYTGNQPIGYV